MGSARAFTSSVNSAKKPLVIAYGYVNERWHHTDGEYTDVGVSSYLNTLLSVCQHVATSLLTLKIILRLTEDGEGRQNMLKCRMNLGVTGLRPPPGGAHAAQMVTSWFVLCVRMEVRNQYKSDS